MPRVAAAALLLLLCISYSLVSVPPQTASAQGYGGNLEQLAPYLHYLAEFSQRRRANIYFPNEQSIFNGVQVNFVNVGRGNLTFARRDLVTVGRVPLVAARVYDSAGRGSAEFGPGWHLSAAETLEVQGGVATLFSENGDAIRFVESNNEFVLSPDFPSDYVRLSRSGLGTLVSYMRTGQTREYELMGGLYRLVRVTGRNGNQVRLIYSGGLMARMENAGHAVALIRNAAGRVTEMRDDQNRRTLYGYDDKGLLIQVTDLGGNLWTYQYTGQDLLHRAVDPGGVRISRRGTDLIGACRQWTCPRAASHTRTTMRHA